MSQSSPPENSMKALMDAVDQVSSGPGLRYAQPSARAFSFPFTDLTSSSPVKMGGTIVPHPTKSTGAMIDNQGGPLRKRNHNSALSEANAVAAKGTQKKARSDRHDGDDKRRKRLEQNRYAAVESRRRKKHMEEELKRSVSYYTKVNTSLRSQNAELERQLLIAKQKVQAKQEENKAESKGTKSTSAVKVGPQYAAVNESSPLRDSKPEAKASAPAPNIVPVSNGIAYSTLFGNAPDADLEKQAQQAQFAATQALYKTMGYPAGAARDAASTFSQFVGLTGVVPGLSAALPVSNMVAAMPHKNEFSTVGSGAAASAVPPQLKCSPLIPLSQTSPPSETASDDDSAYIEALNRFAMQQAAAANAAAAAATAAIQAAHLHNQLKNNGSGSPSSSTQAMAPTMQFLSPTGGMMWPFQNQVSFPSID